MKRALAALLALISILVTAPPAASSPGETWHVWYFEGFDKGDVGWGGWDTGPYTSRVTAYNGFSERNIGPVVFDSKSLTVHDGVLDMWGYKRQLADGSWEPVGAGIVPLIGGKYQGFKYGRFEFSLGMFPEGADAMNRWWFAGLLWPQPSPGYIGGDHCRGEVDFPEMVPGQGTYLFQHLVGTRAKPGAPCTVNPQNTCYSWHRPDMVSAGWHEYRIDWRPDGLTFYRDGLREGYTSCSLPASEMQLKLQLVSLNQMPSASSFGHVLVDWVRISKWYG